MSTGWTRGRLIRAAVAVGAGGAVMAAAHDDDAPLAASSEALDAKILNLFLSLEYVQDAFYREALRTDRLDGDLLTYTRTVSAQEGEHVAYLKRHLGNRADGPPKSAFGDLLATTDSFQDAAIELEEATIAAYIGQAANLRRKTLASVATLVSVEARQAAWIRDIAKVSPAPHAADPARSPDAILSDLRKRGFIE